MYFTILLWLFVLSSNLPLFGARIPSLASQSPSVTTQAAPSSFVNGTVNAIDGTFCYTFHHLDVPGAVPLDLVQYYNSKSNYTSWLGAGMNLNYSFWIAGRLSSGKAHDTYNKYASLLAEAEGGSIICCLAKFDERGNTYYLDPDVIYDGLTNCGSGEISARTNLKNCYFTNKSKNEQYGDWKAYLPDGTVKEYYRSYHFETPMNVKEEYRPDGTRLQYSYYKYHELEGTIRKIVAKRHHTQNWLEFHNGSKKSTVTSSNGEKVIFSFFEREDNYYIDEIDSSCNPKIKLSYGHSGKNYAINKISWPHGRFLEIEYDDKGRVKHQKAPVGKEGEKRTLYSFDYHAHHTEVQNAKGIKSIYRYKDKRLTALEEYMHHKLFRTKALYWGERKGLSWGKHPKTDEGNLICEAILDANEKAHFARHFTYDDYGNVLKETIYGNLTGAGKAAFSLSSEGVPYDSHVEHARTRYTYSNDRLHLKLTETLPSGIHIEYRYKKDTNLVWAKLTYDQSKLLLREFFSYDDDGILIEKIIDDGSCGNKESLTDVTQRFITTNRLVKNREGYGQGQPEEVLERYLDLASGNLIWLKRTEYAYNKSGQITEEKLFDANNTHRYTLTTSYNEMGRIKSKTDALGHTIHYGYDDNANKIYEKLDASGFYTQFYYDPANRLTGKTEHHDDGSKAEERFDYDLMGNMIASTDRYGNTTTYDYDDCNRLYKTTFPRVESVGGSSHHYTIEKEYDIFDNVIAVTNQNGHKTTYEYTALQKPWLIRYPDASSERFEYNRDGTLAHAWDKSGTKTSFTYDVLGRVLTTKVHDRAGKKLKETSATYNAFHIQTSTDEMGYVTYHNYDGAGRKIEEWKGAEDNFSKTTFEYDPKGRLCCTKVHYGYEEGAFIATYLEYDSLDRITTQKKTDGSYACISRTEYAYDILGNCKKVTYAISDEKSAIRRTKHNSKSEPVRTVDEEGHATRIEHDHSHINPLNQKVLRKKSTDALGNSTEEYFDALGRLVFIQKRNSQNTLLAQSFYAYSGTGKKRMQKEYVVIHGSIDHEYTIYWEYDALDRIKKVVEQPGTADEKITSYNYESSGRISRLTKPDGTTLNHTYDALGRLVTLTSSDKTVFYTYSYDLYNNPTEIRDEVSGLVTKRQYDPWGRVIMDGIKGIVETGFHYDPLGRMTTLTAPDGSSVTYLYDNAHLRSIRRHDYEHIYNRFDLQEHALEASLIGQSGLLQSTWDKKGRQVEIVAAHFTQIIPSDGFDAAGNLKKLTFTDAIGRVSFRAEYDDLYQITHEDGIQAHSYLNDSLANRQRKDDTTYSVDHANKIVNAGFAYDKNGNLIAKDGTTFTYDALDRLVKVTAGSESTSYIYDSFHRRIARTNFGGQKCFFVYLGLREIGLYNPDSEKLEEFRVLGLGKGAELGASVVIELDGVRYCPIHDHRGNIVCLVDASTGRAKETYRYTAFGEQEVYDEFGKQLEQSKLDNPWGFASKRYDAESGFVYFSKRYYAPELGRWVTPDPLGFADGPNLYAYVHNNPMTLFDLYGLFAFEDQYDPIDSMQMYGMLETSAQALVDIGAIGGFAFGGCEGYANWSQAGYSAINAYRQAFIEQMATLPDNTATLEELHGAADAGALMREAFNAPRIAARIVRSAVRGSRSVFKVTNVEKAAQKTVETTSKGVARNRQLVPVAKQNSGTQVATKAKPFEKSFPENPKDLLPDLPRDTKGYIYPSDNLRIRPEKHPFNNGDKYNPRHHEQHYHIETRYDPTKPWDHKNKMIIKPSDYQPGSGTGFLPGEPFP